MVGSFGSSALRKEQVLDKEVRIFSFSKKRVFAPKQKLPFISPLLLIMYESSSTIYIIQLKTLVDRHWVWLQILSSLHAHVDLSLALTIFHIHGKDGIFLPQEVKMQLCDLPWQMKCV